MHAAIPKMRRLPLLVLLLAGVAGAAKGDPAAAGLVGLWGASHRFGPQARGVLIIDGRSEEWVAHIAGFDITVEKSGGGVSFMLPNSLGSFKGALSKDHKRIDGNWFQPPAVTGGSFASAVLGASFASPVNLAPVSENVWKGVVAPLRDELSLYLMVEASADGSITGFIRNPETNFAVGHTFTVELKDRLVELRDSQTTSWNLEGAYDAPADRLTLDVPLWVRGKNVFVAFDFTRQDRNEAVGFFPRRALPGKYQYRLPIRTDDGWQTASLGNAGMKMQPVADAIKAIIGSSQKSGGTPSIQGVLAARHGKLVLEEYFYGFDQARPHDLRSVGNSITSTLVGIAIDQGAPFELSSPVYPLVKGYETVANPDPRKAHITVQDLLTMTSGLSGNDKDPSSPGNEVRLLNDPAHAADLYKATLDLPMAADPGGPVAVKFTAGINLMGGVLRQATGVPMIEFFVRNFAVPLDIRKYYLNLTPAGDMYGGGGLYLLPRDALKLGQLYLSGGTWNGRRVVSQKWVEESVHRYAEFSPGHGYGLAWHLFKIPVDGKSYSEFEAEGNGGQVVSVIPELDLTVLFTTGNYDEDETVPERSILTAIMAAVQ
jgi:CubicO group peptidase (beta-lactamase class C family)